MFCFFQWCVISTHKADVILDHDEFCVCRQTCSEIDNFCCLSSRFFYSFGIGVCLSSSFSQVFDVSRCFSVGFTSANTLLWPLSFWSSHDVAEMLQTYVVTRSLSVLCFAIFGDCGRTVMGREGSDISRYTETG